jgi:phosphoribosyl 1,2-cyclic phosphate phosphodiesterase
VPRIGPDWGACDPRNPKNRRRRCSILVERIGPGGVTQVLVDASPDMRAQLLDVEVGTLDAVIITHEHADHTHGLDDLRAITLRMRRRVPVWMDEVTARIVKARFGYCFATPPGSPYPPIVDDRRLEIGRVVTIQGAGGALAAVPFRQFHGDIDALGLRFGRMAYSSDINGVPDESLAQLRDLDLWIVDALRYTPHPSHFSVSETLAWIERLRPKRAVLTNMHLDLDYETLRRQLPANVEPAYDGMRVELPYDGTA